MNIEITCANCKASLKVLQNFAGKTIQCPKCTKKTPVPAVSERTADAPAAADVPAQAPVAPARPAAAKPAPPPEAKSTPAADGTSVSFACANCAAALKVLKSFAGKSIQCPKCAKKTLVPGGAPKEEQAPAAAPKPSAPAPDAAPAVPAPPPPSAPPPVAEKPQAPMPAAVTPPPAPVVSAPPAQPAPDLQPKLREQEQKLDSLTRQMRELELRLDVERLKAEKAEQEKQALASRKAEERMRLQEELSVHFKAEIEAARQTITRLEDKVRTATEQRLTSPPPGVRSAAQIEKELLENPDETMMEAETAVPDAVMSQIRDSRFSRYVRTSILIHAVLMALTSIGTIRGYFVKPPPAPEEGDGTNVVTAVSAPVAVPETGGAVTDAVPAVVPDKPASPPVDKPDAAKPEASKPAAPNPAEALPGPGEKPETQVNAILP